MIIILIIKGKFYYAGAPMEGEYTVSFSEPVVIKWKSKLNDVNVDYELHYKDNIPYETIKALNTSSILLNIECKVSLENYDVNDPDTSYYLNNFQGNF